VKRSGDVALEGYTLATIGDFVGKELGVSDWITVDQQRINEFAACTSDHQWIHVDVERAQRESPFGTTIAHGYLTLSLLPVMQQSVGTLPQGVTAALNYGADRVRFITPVKAGARIRDHITLVAAEEKGGGRVLLTARHTVEIEGEEKPALVADTLALLIG
jgi:acyl dehydratase